MAYLPLPEDVIDLARSQHGVLARRQLTSLGLHHAITRRRITDGTWIDHGRAIVIPAWATDGDEHTAWMLQCEAGFDSIVTGPLAARLGGWFIPGDEHVIVRHSYTRQLPPGVHVLRREVPSPPAQRGLLALATRLDALADTLIIRSWGSACDLLDTALRQQWIDQPILDALIARRSGRGRTGVGRLRQLRLHVTGDHRSEAERRMHDILMHTDTGEWLPNHLVQSRGVVVAELDFAHLECRIALEVDGRAFHSDAARFEHDRLRQNRLVTDGWLVLRFTWKQILEDPMGISGTIRKAVQLRRTLAS